VASAANYAQLVVDSRGQGHDTPDRGTGDGTQWVEGFMTRGIDSPDNYYHRRLMADRVRAVDAVAELPGLCGEGPYEEIAEYLRWHSRHRVEPTFATSTTSTASTSPNRPPRWRCSASA
jgi:cephalosporin-C deacetylase